MKKIIAITAMSSIIITGCASYRPIVDMQGISQSQYNTDLADCQKYAEQVNVGGNTAAGAGIGAGLGALAGLIVGVAFNVDPGELAGFGAAIGGLHGATAGAAGSAKTQKDVICNCMRNRGYSVLSQ